MKYNELASIVILFSGNQCFQLTFVFNTQIVFYKNFLVPNKVKMLGEKVVPSYLDLFLKSQCHEIQVDLQLPPIPDENK
jgi:hypothetical protein